MKRMIVTLVRSLLLGGGMLLGSVLAQTTMAATEAAQTTTTAAAATTVLAKSGVPRTPDLLEHLVDEVLGLFNVGSSGNTATHYAIFALILVGAILLRRFVTTIIFNRLKRLAAKTETTLDDKLFPALEGPVTTFVMVTGIFAAVKVLKLSETTDRTIGYGSTVAFSLVVFWGLLRAFGAVLDHMHEVAREKQMGVAAFMPWIKKTLVAIFVVIGVLITVQSLGFNVSTILSGLGIGGLAFALAAQDTIANLFGSIVVAIDQPFKVGETVRIGANTGLVEDIGLRSTKIRLIDKSLVILPNKLVSSEAIVNLSRFTQRRVEQVIGLTYDTRPDQMEAIVEEVRQIILAEPTVDVTSVMVFFRDFSASSLDLWIVYLTTGDDFQEALALRQRVNLAIMRAVAARGLSFAFPTQTMHLDGPVAKQWVGGKG
ncbi:MAG: mechanosensitive ion channel protein MscS [Opitutia bacterium Tous-C4FEB]|nr:MAG: mechanosensitive ion channel protein MscS [Opitutae bacterium Tous-C5TDCM]PAW91310.1 MAG: mechanosensitive ion channel protein MscS [Opitutae bacterium Tous-C4FEB]